MGTHWSVVVELTTALGFLFLPHLHQWLEGWVSWQFFRLKVIQRLSQYLLHTHIAAVAQEIFRSVDEFGVEVSSKPLGRIVRQYAREHDRVVLRVCPVVVFLGDELADAFGGFGGRGRTRLGGINDSRKMEILIALE